MNAQSPADAEASLLAEINRQDAAANTYLNTFPFGAPSSAIAVFINGLGPVEFGYQRLRPACAWLEQQGRPAARQRLDNALNWLAGQRATYVQMYNDKVQAENRQAGIWQQAVQFGTSQVMAANNYQNAVANRWVQDMFDVNENRCYDCHQIIGVPGGGYCYNCARARGWVY
jgi:hypothetical protein